MVESRQPFSPPAIGPAVGGFVMEHVALAGPVLIGGAVKMAYDVALYRSFRHLKPPEEQQRPPASIT